MTAKGTKTVGEKAATARVKAVKAAKPQRGDEQGGADGEPDGGGSAGNSGSGGQGSGGGERSTDGSGFGGRRPPKSLG